jgi:hypothetical protein
MYVSRNGFEFYVAVLEDWIKLERPQFVCWMSLFNII